jgi:hypothetical protein
MPQAVIPALVATAATAGTAYIAGTAITMTYLAGTFAVNLALTAASQALAPKPKQPNIGGGGNGGVDQSKTITARSSNATRKLIYGETRVGGTFAFIEATDNDQYLHLVIVLAAHELEQFTTVFFNDEALTLSGSNVTSPSKYNGLADIYPVTVGNASNIPAPLLALSNWTSNHKLTDQGYLYARLEFDPDAFEQGLPNISAKVKGRKIYDPRTSTTAWSENPALVIRDYLTDTVYGLGATAAEIDDASFIAAANVCEESVTLSGGGTQDRYTFNGVVDTQNTPRSNLEQMLTALNGSLYYSNGKWSLRAGAYVTPTVTLDEDDLASGLTVTTAISARDSFNAIKGQFVSPASDYQATDYPAITSGTFETEDNGERRYLNLDLPFTDNAARAQRIAKQILFKNRQEISLRAKFKMNAFQFQVGDTVMITNARLGFTQKVFEIVSWKLNFDVNEVTVDCELTETNSAVYDWSAEETAFAQDNTTLPDPFTIPAPTITPSDTLELFNQQAISVLIVDVASTSIYARQFEVEAKLSTETIYKSLGIAAGQRFTLTNVKAGGVYDIRARSINSLGIKSPFATTTHTIVGQAAAASDVTNFSVNVVGSNADLSWTASTDADLSHYIIRHSPLTTGATFNNAQTVVKKVPRPTNTVVTPAKTGTYFVTAVNKFGGQSLNADSSVVLVDDISGLNLSNSLSEHTGFTGTKTTCVVVEDTLRLDTTNLFDSVAGNFDDATGLFGGGSGFVASSGTYDFANYIDLGAVFTAQATATLKFTQFSQHTGTPASGATDVDLFVSTTQDDPAGSPSWTAYRQFVVGTYTARALRFRANLTSTDSQETPAISELTAEIRLPTRTESDNDIQSGAGAKAVTFTNAFKALRAVSISVGDMQSGDYYGITNKSATGFTITFYNSSNVAVDRLFDYVATGF